jgi:hypothetical protein
VEAYGKDLEDSGKATKTRPAPKAANTAPVVDYSTDDGVDNGEFARQLASVKQGTTFTGPKSGDEKRPKYVKQSRAQEIAPKTDEDKVSAPSSTADADADADDDQSSLASPRVAAADANDVSDMLEMPAAGPSVLRLTDTDKVKPKEKKAKAPEKVETKKQRQNRKKAEAAKAEREEAEKKRKVQMEAQRRLARISEGRAAKDGSGFTAQQAQPSVWTGHGANGESSGSLANQDFMPVQPLDTYEPANTDASKSSAPSIGKADSWMSSLPSEEEQIELLRGEEAWSTVKTKKSGKTKQKEEVTSDDNEGPAATKPQQVTPATAPSPSVVAKTQTAGVNGRTAKFIKQESSFAALSVNDGPEVEEEWDV